MGKNKRGYNWKARQHVSGTVDNSETDKLATKIALPTHEYFVDTSDSNALVLPSKKRKFKADKDSEPVGRILSKKKRKHLEKVVDRRKKKEERSDLLEKLEKVQADQELLSKMVSLSSIQTKGLKKVFAEEDWKERMESSGIALEQVVMDYDDVELPKKIKLKKPKKPQVLVNDDPNVLGFANSSSDDESGSESEESEESEEDSESPEIVEKSEEIEEKVEKIENVKKPAENKKIELVEKFENVPVFRTPEVIESRSKLPIIGNVQFYFSRILQSKKIVKLCLRSMQTIHFDEIFFKFYFRKNKSLKNSSITEQKILTIFFYRKLKIDNFRGKIRETVFTFKLRSAASFSF